MNPKTLGAGRLIARDVRGHCIDSFKFFRWMKQYCKHIFLSATLLFRATNPFFENIRK